MKVLNKRFFFDHSFQLLSYLLIFSIFYSKFLLSISIIALCLISLFNMTSLEHARLKLNPSFFPNVKQSFKVFPIVLIYCIFFLTLLSYFNSENSSKWLVYVRLKLPYLALPLVFINQSYLSKRQYQHYYFFLLQMCVLSGIFVIINYGLNYEEITSSIGRGHAVPTPINHTKYSILIAISILAGVLLKRDRYYAFSTKERIWLTAEIVFLFILLHIISARSGIVAFYLTTGIFGLYYLIKQKRWLLLVIFILSVIYLPFIAYKTIPAFHNKIHYALYDLNMNKFGKGVNYSDAERLRSWETGYMLFTENPLFGIGIGDLEDENRKLYIQSFEKISTAKLPHNQFLFYAAAFGLIGLCLFTVFYFYPLFYKKNYQEPFLCMFIVMILWLCLVEKPLERSNFITLHLFFILAGMSYLRNWEMNHEKG